VIGGEAVALKIVRWESLTPTPWKNGGGTAVDIAGQPEPMTNEGLDWRVNIATIARSGPFSNFPGIDRDFRVLDGGGVELAVEGQPPRLLMADGPGYRFPGDRPTYARLLRDDQPCRAFNVLTRRGVFVSEVKEVVIERDEVFRPEVGAFIVVRSGTLEVEFGADLHRLGLLDAFVTSERVSVHTTDEVELFLVNVTRV